MLDSLRRWKTRFLIRSKWHNFKGSLCERPRSCDDDKACLNGGKCVGNSAGDVREPTCGYGTKKKICTLEDRPNYHCECKTGFSGHWCEKTNACHPMKVNPYPELGFLTTALNFGGWRPNKIIFSEYMWRGWLYYSNSKWNRKPCLSMPWKLLWKIM